MCLCVGMCLHVSTGTNLRRPKALDPVELELQVIHLHEGWELGSSARACTLSNTKPAIPPARKYFKNTFLFICCWHEYLSAFIVVYLVSAVPVKARRDSRSPKTGATFVNHRVDARSGTWVLCKDPKCPLTAEPHRCRSPP